MLLDAEFTRVVRTRRVRAIEESFYGSTARNISFYWAKHPTPLPAAP